MVTNLSQCVLNPVPSNLPNVGFSLQGMEIPIVTHCKYLGVIMSEHNSDNVLKIQMKKFYANANMLIRKFSKCSVNFKCYLFKTYCSTMYCSALWSNSTETALTK